MNFSIRFATENDMSQVLDLITELAVFEKEPDAVEITEQDLIRDGFKEHLFKCFIAETEKEVVGMALFYPRYSTWKGKTIHLEDLVVKEAKRATGVGSALFSEVIKYGHAQGVKRIEWVVLDWNEPAVKFYEKNGAHILRDWDTVQLDEQGIQNFINTNA
ncbi:GNAT family N-acetyltransferase [Zhouia sp. PK063]|uniref:GNAT family N-acetyltransferase n=1 Tax=Zhouia sp. PK063 TaxID=3373602 RepID=UPI0037AF28E1